MPPFAECCAVIPCNTIEDFPTRLDSAGARSLLGGLTAIWHPRLIAAAGRTPTWYRADEAPASIRAEPGRYRLIVVPETCMSLVPSEFRDVIDSAPFGIVPPDSPEYVTELVVRVQDRSDAITQIMAACELATSRLNPTAVSGDDPSDPDSFDESKDWMVHCEASELTNGRSIDARDFYALGYTWWQVQVLTRRLRYTSNLDQIHFENQLQAAAEAITSGNAKVACESLHDCFDALAEERDHYFSSDPSLIDLTLLTPGTISKWIESDLANLPTDDASSSKLSTPANVLIDEDVANAIASHPPEVQNTIRAALRSGTKDSGTETSGIKASGTVAGGTVGWCGGGPSASFQQEHHGIDGIEMRIAEGMQASRQVTGELPIVYARLGGGVASHWLSAITSAGFQGVVPIDFLNGRGFESESKVIIGEGSSEIEALTAKPMDANDDSSFLTLGTTLGEAIDGGEIATGLMVHWPGEGCDSFRDVRRAATWTLALGKFWKIDDYFTEGERPYHHGQSPHATGSTETRVGDAGQLAEEFTKQTTSNLRGMLALVDPKTVTSGGETASDLRRMIASAIGYETVPNSQAKGATAANALLIHPAHPATRESVVLSGRLAGGNASVFHATSENDQTSALVDVPAWGFAAIGDAVSQASSDSTTGTPNLVQKLGKWLRRPSRKILEGTQLSNEFMEVSVNREHGGVDGVYSGQGRGNRFSSRLIQTPTSSKDFVAAVCDSFSVIENTRVSAIIELKGRFVAATGKALAQSTWTAQYQLDRGSRRLQYRLQIVAPGVDKDHSPWKSSASLRIAVADAAPIIRSIKSERLQRTSARSFESSMGFAVEEADERTTLIASDHPTLHRRVEDRFIDTLIADSGKTSQPDTRDWHRFEFGFDVANCVATAKSLVIRKLETDISVPIAISSNQATKVAQQGWLLHVSPMSLEAQVVDVAIINDSGEARGNSPKPNSEYLAIHFRVIQAAGRAAKATLRFCRDVHAAVEVSSVSRPLQDRANPIDLAGLDSLSVSQSLKVESDRVRWNQPSHGVTHLVVLFPTGGQSAGPNE